MTAADDNAYARLTNRVFNARAAINDNLHQMRGRCAEYEAAIAQGLPLPAVRFGDLAAALDDTASAEQAWQTARDIVESSEARYASDTDGEPAVPPTELPGLSTLRDQVWSHVTHTYWPGQIFRDVDVAAALDANRQSINWILWHLWRDGVMTKLEDVARRDRNHDYVRYAIVADDDNSTPSPFTNAVVAADNPTEVAER
jgi:hypothetical protein